MLRFLQPGCFLIALFCICLQPVYAQQAVLNDMQSQIQTALDSKKRGDHAEAIRQLKQILKTLELHKVENGSVGFLNQSLAEAYMLMTPPDPVSAVPCYRTAIKLYQSDSSYSALVSACETELYKATLSLKLVAKKNGSIEPQHQQTTISQDVQQPIKKNPEDLNKPSPQAQQNRPVKDKCALVIGISKFANPKYNLEFAAKDARDFYNFLITEANFRKDHVLLLLDDKATRTNIMSAFGDNFLPAVCLPDDLVVVYISTHGTPSKRDKGGRNYIVAHDTDTASLYATGVDMNELYRRIKEGVKTDRALIVMDTCFSGAGVPGAKALNVADNFDAQEVAQGCGHLVITSSSPNERSWESKVSSNSVFTKYLLEALRKNSGKIDVKSAFTTAQKSVSWEVQNAFGESQTPQLGGQWEGKELILSVPATQPRPMLNSDLLQLMGGNNEPVSRGNAAKDLPVVTKPKKAVPGSDPWKKLERFR